MTDDAPIVVERTVAASPATIFRYFTDPARWTAWQGVDAEIEPRPGGVFRVNVTGADTASGRFVEVVPDRKVVFTWGWEGEGAPVPPGSSTVAIELVPQDDGSTLLRLTHSGLPPGEIDVHRAGWDNYTARLAAVATGADPGPDPLRR